MSNKSVTMKQVAVDTGVPYSTIRSWQKSRPELHGFLLSSYDSQQVIIDQRADIDALNLLINSIHKQTEV